MMETFFEICIHGSLYYREIYPRTLFEQRQLGKLFGCKANDESGKVWLSSLLVWQCRHPDVTTYIKRVLTNINPLIQGGVVERIILAVKDKRGETLDHFSIKCTFERDETEGGRRINLFSDEEDRDFRTLQEEMVSAILRLSALESQLPRPPIDCNWTLLCVTKETDEKNADVEAMDALRSALHCGEWMVENNQLTEQITRSKQVQKSSLCVYYFMK